MLTIYRRHTKLCEHRKDGRKYRRCRCPIWVDGFLGKQETRHSLRTRDWDNAQKVIREWEAEGDIKQDSSAEPISVREACEAYLSDAKARNLREPTLYKYRLLFRQLQEFARQTGLRYLRELDVVLLRQFRAQWPNRNLGALKKLEYLRAFFRFAHDNTWIPDNPARKVKSPKVDSRPTMPFTHEEVSRILAACEEYPDAFGRVGQQNVKRLRALVLLLRYSGLRIQDAVTLSRDRVVNGKLLLYTAKTGTPVYCPLPDCVVNALEALPAKNRYFFWSGASTKKSATSSCQRSLQKLFALAGVARGHAHRFRDTFAVELLLSGVPLERVSALLGHQSVRVTERHYAPWVSSRQEQLEADVKRAWLADPVAFAQTKGTQEVHGKKACRQLIEKQGRKSGSGGGTRTHGLGIMRPSLYL